MKLLNIIIYQGKVIYNVNKKNIKKPSAVSFEVFKSSASTEKQMVGMYSLLVNPISWKPQAHAGLIVL